MGFFEILDAINGVIWHNAVLYIVLGVGVLFTIWSGFCQYKAMTHGVQVTRGVYDNHDDPGAINHFQALSAALSATVGLGNIGGVALAISLGGPGAVFWMWMVGLVGMALKTTEVTLSMMYRKLDEHGEPHGGPMFVAREGFEKMGLGWLGRLVGGTFVFTLLIAAITGGNMFQAWNVADVSYTSFGIPQELTGVVLTVLVGIVIIGGIRRIGRVTEKLVPLMCLMYLLAAFIVVFMNIGKIPDLLRLIVAEAFTPTKAEGAFLGGTAGYALLWGMKRALFSSEAGQGSSPIAHAAAKTDEPVREGVVAGLEPFIDTLVVCTLTTLVILSTGVWNRPADLKFASPPAITAAATEGQWTLEKTRLIVPEDKPESVTVGFTVFTVVSAHENPSTGEKLHRTHGKLTHSDQQWYVEWSAFASPQQPTVHSPGAFFDFQGASLTKAAFDAAIPGLGKWLVPISAWLFALSTIISWSYYGEQGVVYLFGNRAILPYKIIYCALVLVSCLPALIRTDAQLDSLTALGTGIMLWANIPIMLIFGKQAMDAYHDYFRRLNAGEMEKPHEARTLVDLLEEKPDED